MLVSMTSRMAPSEAVIAMAHLSVPLRARDAAKGDSRLRSDP